MKLKIGIFLTATIDPGGMTLLERKDPITRENDYLRSIKKWINEDSQYKIIFCENSGYDLKKIKLEFDKSKKKQYELLQFMGNNFNKKRGKGYGEFLIFKHALKYSTLLNDCDYIIKVTGRYFIKNISMIIDRINISDDVYVYADMKRDFTFTDSRLFIFKPSFFNNFLITHENMIDDSKGFFFEHALNKAVIDFMSKDYKWQPLPCLPFFEGYYGTENIKYSNSYIRWFYQNLKNSLKNNLNKNNKIF